jgi:hypothetical protein
MATKVCSKCGEEKELSEFHKKSSSKDGFFSFCKRCNSQRVLEWQKNNKDLANSKSKKWISNNLDKANQSRQLYKNNNPDKVKKSNKKWNDSNPGRNRLAVKRWLSDSNNRDKINKHNKQRYTDDVNYRLTMVLRARLRAALKNNQKVGSAVKDLGCSVEELKVYLESKFQEGMSWDNYGLKGWHIDHIKPLSSFNLEDSEELRKACHYNNLQPLWAEDNLRKSNKILPLTR